MRGNLVVCLGKDPNLIPRRCPMRLYAAFDLHGNNNFLAVIDRDGRRIFSKRLLNDPERIVDALKPYKKDLTGIVVESTYNW